MIWSRTSSVAPCSEMARRICSGSSASFLICGASPLVEVVMCRAPTPSPHGAVMIRIARLTVGDGLAHSHKNDIVDLVAALAFHCDDLIDNLVRAQIARKSFQAARAKFAA